MDHAVDFRFESTYLEGRRMNVLLNLCQILQHHDLRLHVSFKVHLSKTLVEQTLQLQ